MSAANRKQIMTDNRYAYPCRPRKDSEGRILISFRDVPEALTDGATKEEALFEAADALSAALAGYLVGDRELPTPSSARRGEYLVAPPNSMVMKIAVCTTARRKKVTPAELARALRIDLKEAHRIMDPDHNTKTDRMTVALAAMGVATDVVWYDASETRRVLSAPGFVRPAELSPKSTLAVRPADQQ